MYRLNTMPNRLSRLFSSSAKEKEALAQADSNRSPSPDSPPPEYEPEAPEYDRDNVLEPPDITAGFNSLILKPNDTIPGFPQTEECIAHLKVLECFYRLRQAVGSCDGLFGIKDGTVSASSDGLHAKLAEKRWACFVQKAVDRFEIWWRDITPDARMADRTYLETAGRQGQLVNPKFARGQSIVLERTSLPPVDVLMVWHAYMLNPRAYLEDCLRYGRMPLWHMPFPWQAVSDSINAESFKYEPGQAAEVAALSLTGLRWNSLEDLRDRVMQCTECKAELEVPWTTCHKYAPAPGRQDSVTAIDTMLSSGTGFCDKDFRVTCKNCMERMSHNQLRSAKFCNDVKNLLGNDVPLGGTVLGDQGLPWIAFGKRDIQTETITRLPNALFLHGLGETLLQWRKKGKTAVRSMDEVRTSIEDATRDSGYMRKVRNSYAHKMQRTERIAIRKMMSRYWENSSPFALDLVGAVIRQGAFIEKMHNIDWLHSPALPNTMSRLITKYSYFQKIMAQNPQHMAVPTLDVDLAWHTHQLTPYRYMEYTVRHTGQFIDHDDKVAETKLNDSFAWTSKTYQKMTGEPYSECTCWYCEATRESHTSAASRLFNTPGAKATELLHSAPQDPRKSVHVSAHNAVRPTDDDKAYAALSKSKADALEKQYEKACERARKKGKPIPKRDDYYYSDAYGYPVYIPAYSPYIGFIPYAPL